MPNLFKRFSSLVKAEPYQFPDARELEDREPGPVEEQPEPENTPLEPEQESDPMVEEPEEESLDPVSYAKIQADMILRDARREARQEAEAILDKARLDAELAAEDIRTRAREAGREEGYADGLAQGRQEAAQELEALAAAQEAEVQKFLDRAGAELDRQMDDSVDDLRDLAMAIAEKVICISLKSSGDVISRMIQTAIDKRKRREWVHIYIAECDAKRLGQIPAALSASLSALSDRVRIIPMADDESGTCIIEMPDEIVDASAGTQLNNIRSLRMGAASSSGGSLF